jgi:hypothetical protein
MTTAHPTGSRGGVPGLRVMRTSSLGLVVQFHFGLRMILLGLQCTRAILALSYAKLGYQIVGVWWNAHPLRKLRRDASKQYHRQNDHCAGPWLGR